MSEAFVTWWRHIPANIDPVMISLGPLHIRWYGFMYLVALGVCYFLIRYRIKKHEVDLPLSMFENVLFWGMVAVLVGARLGYVFFYNFDYYIRHPLEIILPFQFSPQFAFIGFSGMSYHGGLICFSLTLLFLERRYRLGAFTLLDLFATAFPLGYTFGRLGNFINGELYGRVTTGWWGMYFPNDPTRQLRWPSQLFEAFFEGIVLFAFMWSIRNIKPFHGFHAGIYLMGYGVARFFIEYIRQPDEQLGTLWGGFTMGQFLCMGMILCGGLLLAVQRARAQRS